MSRNLRVIVAAVVIIAVAGIIGFFVSSRRMPVSPAPLSPERGQQASETEKLPEPPPGYYEEIDSFYTQFAVENEIPRPDVERREFRWRFRDITGERPMIKEVTIKGEGFTAEKTILNPRRPLNLFFRNRGYELEPYMVTDGGAWRVFGYKKAELVCVVTITPFVPDMPAEAKILPEANLSQAVMTLDMNCGSVFPYLPTKTIEDATVYFSSIDTQKEPNAIFPLTVAKGEEFVVGLPSDLVSGYSWVPLYDPLVVTMSGRTIEDILPTATSLPGKKEIFTFQTIVPGETELIFLLERGPGGVGTMYMKQVVYAVTIK